MAELLGLVFVAFLAVAVPVALVAIPGGILYGIACAALWVVGER